MNFQKYQELLAYLEKVLHKIDANRFVQTRGKDLINHKRGDGPLDVFTTIAVIRRVRGNESLYELDRDTMAEYLKLTSHDVPNLTEIQCSTILGNLHEVEYFSTKMFRDMMAEYEQCGVFHPHMNFPIGTIVRTGNVDTLRALVAM